MDSAFLPDPRNMISADGCPECGSMCISRVSSGGNWCANCGRQWNEARADAAPGLTGDGCIDGGEQAA
jgi:hypothetical protein